MGWRGSCARVVLLAFGWWGISEGHAEAYRFGVVVVAIAVGASLSHRPPRAAKWSFVGLSMFAMYFVIGSVVGGFEVAMRAYQRRISLTPSLVRYRFRLRPGPGRPLFTGALTLMPGSLAVGADGVDGEFLLVHVLIDGENKLRDLALLEARVARATGEELEAAHE